LKVQWCVFGAPARLIPGVLPRAPRQFTFTFEDYTESELHRLLVDMLEGKDRTPLKPAPKKAKKPPAAKRVWSPEQVEKAKKDSWCAASQGGEWLRP
jgi:hypothetical protein